MTLSAMDTLAFAMMPGKLEATLDTHISRYESEMNHVLLGIAHLFQQALANIWTARNKMYDKCAEWLLFAFVQKISGDPAINRVFLICKIVQAARIIHSMNTLLREARVFRERYREFYLAYYSYAAG